MREEGKGREMKMDVINAIEVEPLRKRSSCLEFTGFGGAGCMRVRNVKSEEK
jgi:hypothetical protein